MVLTGRVLRANAAHYNSVFIPFQYYPRTKTLRPLLHFSSLSSDIKSSPDGWHQATVAVKIPKKPELAPIYLHVRTPVTRMSHSIILNFEQYSFSSLLRAYTAYATPFLSTFN